MKSHTRNDAVDAAIILNDFIGDITAGVVVLMHYRDRLLSDNDNRHALTAVQKMCLSHLIWSYPRKVDTFSYLYCFSYAQGLM